jgi:two-component system phosphate regulon response regulator PhoB
VDDEPDLLGIVELVLKKKGFNVTALEAPPTVDELMRIDPDVVFLDLLLKGQHGADICQRFKADPRSRDVPVVIVSAHTVSEVKEACRACSADDYLTKPFDIHELGRKAEYYGIQHQQHRGLA